MDNKNKDLLFSDEARKLIIEGAREVYKAVSSTLGAKGRNVVIHTNERETTVTKDGVTVAKSINFKNLYKDAGAQLIKEAAEKTCNEAGDGTTTSTVLAYSIIKKGVKAVNNGANPVLLKRGMDKAVDKVVETLRSISKPIDVNSDDLINIATVSANNDKALGLKIAEAIKAVGKDGIVNAEGVYAGEDEIKIIDGFSVDMGAPNVHFIKDMAKMRTEVENPLILIYDHKIEQSAQIIPALEFAVTEKRPLVVIAENSAPEAVGTLAMNTARGAYPTLFVRVPYSGNTKTEILEDIATLTGGVVVSDENCVNIEDVAVQNEVFGEASKIIVERNKTTIVGGCGEAGDIQERIADLKNRSENKELTDAQLKAIKKRIGRLIGKAAVVTVGASSEIEVKEKLDRVEDAIWAVRSAIDEGIVPGGGAAYLKVQKCLNKFKGNSEDEEIGIRIIKESIESPLVQIARNAGEKEDVVVERVKNSRNKGWNALTGKYEDLIKSGIIDPVKVSRVALENAASTAGMLLTTECIIIDNLE